MPNDEFSLMSSLDFGNSDTSTLTNGRERGLQEIRAIVPAAADAADARETPVKAENRRTPRRTRPPREEEENPDRKRAITVSIPNSLHIELYRRYAAARRTQEEAILRGEKVPSVSYSSVLSDTLKKGLGK